MATTAAIGAEAHAHEHPATSTYVKIGIILFVFTALEVFSYEVAHKPAEYGAMSAMLAPVFIPVLIALSVAKFALVGMYYMHLKGDSRLLTLIFCFSLVIALVVVFGLTVLQSYLFNHGVPPLVR